MQIGVGVLVSEQESTCEHIVHSKSSEIICLDNTNLFLCIVSLVKALLLKMAECPSHSCHMHLTEFRQSGYAYSVTITITVTAQAKHIFPFSTFPDFSLTTVKFPDFSRFSRLVDALKLYVSCYNMGLSVFYFVFESQEKVFYKAHQKK